METSSRLKKYKIVLIGWMCLTLASYSMTGYQALTGDDPFDTTNNPFFQGEEKDEEKIMTDGWDNQVTQQSSIPQPSTPPQPQSSASQSSTQTSPQQQSSSQETKSTNSNTQQTANYGTKSSQSKPSTDNFFADSTVSNIPESPSKRGLLVPSSGTSSHLPTEAKSKFVPSSTDPSSTSFFIDANTGEFNKTDKTISYTVPAKSVEQALGELGIDASKRITSIADIKLDPQFKADSLQLSKQKVYEFYINHKTSTAEITLKYDSNTNIVYAFVTNPAIGKSVDYTPIVGTMFQYKVYNLNDSYLLSSNPLESEEGLGQMLQVTPVEGCNGYLQVIIDDIPYVIFMNPMKEPVLSTSNKDRFNDLTHAHVSEVANPYYAPEAEEHLNEYSSDSFFGDDTSQNTPTDQPVDTTSLEDMPSSAMDELNKIKSDLEKQKSKIQSVPSSLWGTKETDSESLKKNISDGKDIRAKKGVILDVIDAKGNQKDMVQETLKTKPANIKKARTVELYSEDKPVGLPPTAYLSLVMTIIGLMLYLYYLQLFKKEYKRDLETRGLMGITDSASISADNYDDLDYSAALLGGTSESDNE